MLDWRTNPFEPHRIAAYRTVAYQKTVVMKYLDNLIAWGDHLFRQDTMESINEATQLYVLAAEILGPRPKTVPPAAKPPLQDVQRARAAARRRSPTRWCRSRTSCRRMPGDGGDGARPARRCPMLYFCIPHNEKLLGYWDTVADRLYKIRHCMNIEGVVRQLALFEPPIDPGALVKAVAGGRRHRQRARRPRTRRCRSTASSVLLQKANEVCGDVKALGRRAAGGAREARRRGAGPAAPARRSGCWRR